MIEPHQDLSQQVPTDIASHVLRFGDEAALRGADALIAVNHMTDRGFAIVGAELWRVRGQEPVWQATSDYSCGLALPWHEYQLCCAAGARQFIQRFQSEPDAAFTLTWMQATDGAALQNSP